MWRIEIPAAPAGYDDVVQGPMTPMFDVQEAWGILHTQVPRLFENGVIACRGKLRPGQTIQVDVQREEVEVAVRFELAQKGHITFTHERISNMSPRSEAPARFMRNDPRIPPYACYEHVHTGHVRSRRETEDGRPPIAFCCSSECYESCGHVSGFPTEGVNGIHRYASVSEASDSIEL
jgi:hypothetical protein